MQALPRYYYNTGNLITHYAYKFFSTCETKVPALVVMESTKGCELVHCRLTTPFAVSAWWSTITRDWLIKRALFHGCSLTFSPSYVEASSLIGKRNSTFWEASRPA